MKKGNNKNSVYKHSTQLHPKNKLIFSLTKVVLSLNLTLFWNENKSNMFSFLSFVFAILCYPIVEWFTFFFSTK